MAKDSSNGHTWPSDDVERQLRALEAQRMDAARKLEAAVKNMEEAKSAATEAEYERNSAIWLAKESGVSMVDIMALAKFKSRDAVYKAIERRKNQT